MDVRKRIAALMAKTTAAGCTEAEAMAAAEAAARLMREHGLSSDDIEMVSATSEGSTRRATWRDRLANVIAHCTNTAVIAHPRQLEFIGVSPGPEIAAYLRDICINAVEREVKCFQTSEFYRRRRTSKTRHQATTDFVFGMTGRLEVRLWKTFADVRDRDRLAASVAAMERRYGGKLTDRRLPARKTEKYVEAALAGIVAGEKVALNRGVGGGGIESQRLEYGGAR